MPCSNQPVSQHVGSPPMQVVPAIYVCYCRVSLLHHTVTKKFIEQFTQHRCEIMNQDVSTRGSSVVS